MLPEPFQRAVGVLEKIEANGQQAFFVGGCVRDFLLNRTIGDIDITTSATPDIIQKIFSKTIPVGIEHGTVIVRYERESYEVTTFRLEGKYSDQRHPDTVEFIDKLDQDLERRDFTINALAMNKDGNIIDLFNGTTDLEYKRIKTVGNSFDRFQEDPLRIIRALRFSSQLGFSIETKTFTAMNELKHEIDTLAIERITKEMTKFFAGKYIQNGLHYFSRIKLNAHLPILGNNDRLFAKLPEPMQPLTAFSDVIALFHYLEPNIGIKEWVKQWKCSNRTLQNATHLSEALQYYNRVGLDNWLVYKLPQQLYEGFLQLVAILFKDNSLTMELLQQHSSTIAIQSKRDLKIDGQEVIALFPHYKKGPWINQLLNAIEKQVVLGNIQNTKSDLKEWIKWNPPVIN